MTVSTFRSNVETFGRLSRRKKSLRMLEEEMDKPIVIDGNGQKLKRCLSVLDLLAFGVGAIIGSGIFVLTGVAAKEKAGPAIVLSYVVSGFACALSGLSYAEFATRVPSSGSTYSYSYIVVGELVAWIIGWDLTLEYMIASATVARGWSGYLSSIITAGGGYLPHPFNPISLASGFSLDLIAFLSVVLLTLVTAFGMKESARFNKIFVAIKVAIVLFVIIVGSFYTDTKNWDNFTPFGAKGIFNAAAITFFAYLGFDGVCNVAEEVKNPQRDLPIGILGSLGISTVLYVGVAIVLTLMVPYTNMDVNAPVSQAFGDHGLKWAEIIVSIGAFAGLTTAQLSGLLSQPRLYFSLSRDGLLPKWFSYIHPRFKTPFYSTIFTGVCAAVIALFVEIDVLADMVSIGTLLSFTLVSTCVLIMRYPVITDKSQSTSKWIVRDFPLFLQRPMYLCIMIAVLSGICTAGYSHDLHYSVIIVFGVLALIPSAIVFFLVPDNIPPGFKCPWVPFLPILSIWVNMYLMVSLSWETWVRLVVWLVIGLLIYVFYGQKHSRVGREAEMIDIDDKYDEELTHYDTEKPEKDDINLNVNTNNSTVVANSVSHDIPLDTSTDTTNTTSGTTNSDSKSSSSSTSSSYLSSPRTTVIDTTNNEEVLPRPSSTLTNTNADFNHQDDQKQSIIDHYNNSD
ncbi:putative cationic amino acid transporter [Heterostelium album PN500]|uniref:Putative cationic amino acid transporter n=1 Tax=Heterostelium pallidum (strain ATCC 26659 / Pp 5 / PN500) TaxID=670386 RepID=D3AWC2_HETP5|nr:putative cationic amino acid transporter [Heterostelium album PN500]EFA86595.1 putative cationic amino acid transporter [Heterostelium album PN500]|eukprot:XP_020438700.1 putative cationic amino acid transporter [Heterostelium album PN500]